MRTLVLTFVLAVVVALGMVTAAPAERGPDSGSISRDASGPQPAATYDALGGPPTPRVFGLGQQVILVVGVVLLVVAAALGAYTLILARGPRTDEDRQTPHRAMTA